MTARPWESVLLRYREQENWRNRALHAEHELAEAERLLTDLLAWKKPGEDGRTRYEGDPPWQARAFLDRKNRT